MIIIYLIPVIFFGWSLGANDGANVFGPTVINGIIKYRNAVLISAGFVLLGAMLDGRKGLETLSAVSSQTLASATISVICAAVSMTIMTYIGIPASSSQAMMGSIIGIGLLKSSVDWSVIIKVIICWIATPIGSIFFAFVLYKTIGYFFNKIPSIVGKNMLLKIMGIVIGAYGSYALGANNVANVTGPFAEFLDFEMAALIGGLSIGFGIISYSKKVMYTVGKSIVQLDYFSSVISVFALSFTLWIFALIGVPVSSSQAIVGAVIGAGLARGSTHTINKKTVKKISLGWLSTPLISGIFSALIFFVLSLFFKL